VINDGTIVTRILIAAALGAVIGVERELRDQPAGLRTHLLVAVGSCLFALVGAVGFQFFAPGDSTAIRADVTRVASQIVVGIGFLGGGTILRSGQTIRGLTTAASLWVTAAIGLAVAVGFYVGAVTTAAVVIVALAGFKPLEKKMTSFRTRGGGNGSSAAIPPD
jgi:putative Mg2+ transporter-C (MgtC) family protein